MGAYGKQPCLAQAAAPPGYGDQPAFAKGAYYMHLETPNARPEAECSGRGLA